MQDDVAPSDRAVDLRAAARVGVAPSSSPGRGFARTGRGPIGPSPGPDPAPRHVRPSWANPASHRSRVQSPLSLANSGQGSRKIPARIVARRTARTTSASDGAPPPRATGDGGPPARVDAHPRGPARWALRRRWGAVLLGLGDEGKRPAPQEADEQGAGALAHRPRVLGQPRRTSSGPPSLAPTSPRATAWRCSSSVRPTSSPRSSARTSVIRGGGRAGRPIAAGVARGGGAGIGGVGIGGVGRGIGPGPGGRPPAPYPRAEPQAGRGLPVPGLSPLPSGVPGRRRGGDRAPLRAGGGVANGDRGRRGGGGAAPRPGRCGRRGPSGSRSAVRRARARSSRWRSTGGGPA